MFLLFFSIIDINSNKTVSKIKKHVGVSTQGCVRPNGGGYNPHHSGSGRNPRHWVVHPPSYLLLCVSYIIIFKYHIISFLKCAFTHRKRICPVAILGLGVLSVYNTYLEWGRFHSALPPS